MCRSSVAMVVIRLSTRSGLTVKKGSIVISVMFVGFVFWYVEHLFHTFSCESCGSQDSDLSFGVFTESAFVLSVTDRQSRPSITDSKGAWFQQGLPSPHDRYDQEKSNGVPIYHRWVGLPKIYTVLLLPSMAVQSCFPLVDRPSEYAPFSLHGPYGG